MASSSPVVARWELSRRLTARRRELGVDVKSITDALGFTRNYWSAVENDRTLIAEDKLRLLFGVLDLDEPSQAELLQLREDSRKRGWWDEFPSLNEAHKRFFGMEAGADAIRTYSGNVVPGILQIESYARAIIASDPDFSPVQVDLLAKARRMRQSVLFDSEPPTVTVLISEAVLHQHVAAPDVHIEQLRAISKVAGGSQNGVTVRILPFDRHPGSIINSASLLFLEYENRYLPTTAWEEGVQLLGHVAADDDRFRFLDLSWEDGVSRSLDVATSVAKINEAIEAIQ